MGAFGSIPALMAADKEQLLLVPDIGDITAEGILQFFADAGNRALIERLRDAGLNMEAEKKASSGVLAGKTYVITGSVMTFANRDAFSEYITERGGKLAGSVSKKTAALINNDAASTSGKNKKAMELGIPVMTEEAFLAYVKSLEEADGA